MESEIAKMRQELLLLKVIIPPPPPCLLARSPLRLLPLPSLSRVCCDGVHRRRSQA